MYSAIHAESEKNHQLIIFVTEIVDVQCPNQCFISVQPKITSSVVDSLILDISLAFVVFIDFVLSCCFGPETINCGDNEDPEGWNCGG